MEKFDSTTNPITGWPNDHKRYKYNAEPNTGPEPEPENIELDDKKVQQLLDTIRWRGARKIRGYKFSGPIPEPKFESDYLPNNHTRL